MEKWTISTKVAGPSLNQTHETVECSYAEAVELAKKQHATHGRAVSIKAADDYYVWFHLNKFGGWDKNRPGGTELRWEGAMPE